MRLLTSQTKILFMTGTLGLLCANSLQAGDLSRATYRDILDFSVRNIGASGLTCLSNLGHWLDSRLTGETSRRYTQLSRWVGRGEGFPGGLFVIDHSVDSYSNTTAQSAGSVRNVNLAATSVYAHKGATRVRQVASSCSELEKPH